jgi:hypothetical protein
MAVSVLKSTSYHTAQNPLPCEHVLTIHQTTPTMRQRLDVRTLFANARLQTSSGDGKNSARKADVARLFFHTLVLYLIRIFV